MSRDRHFLVRGFVGATTLITALVAAESCGFPDHSFIDDKQFYGSTGGATSLGPDASQGGTAGVNSGGASGASVGGTGAEGGTVGKGSGGQRPDSGTTPGTGGTDGGGTLDAATDAAEAGPVCAPGLSVCPPSLCVDFLGDVNHCGDCVTQCKGTDVCTSGHCVPPCAAGLTECKPVGSTVGTCVDTTSDENNCAGCNKPCPSGFVCDQSKCVVDCGSLTRCGTTCTDVTTDDVHCGDCNTNCKTLGEVCSGGKCQASCSSPFVACGNTCVNLKTDNQNCKTCGTACLTGQSCQNGVCTQLIENCSNGVDDDQNGLVDCADPHCSAFTCAGTPAGWTGPIALWSGTPGTDPSCSTSGGYPAAVLTANAGLVIPPYTCPSCTCAPASGTYCDDPTFVFDTSTDCTDKSPWQSMAFPPSATCRATEQELCCANPSARSMRLTNPPASYVHGSCTASQGTPQFPGTTWSKDVSGCGAPIATGGGCTAGQCVPKPAAPFGSQLCIFRSGVSTCPTDYPVQQPGTGQQYYQTVQEGRSCSACSCSPSCGGTLTISTDSNCSVNSTVVSFSPGKTCTTIPADTTQDKAGGVSDTRTYTLANAGPVCGTSPSTLSGQPSPSGPVTVCCQAP